MECPRTDEILAIIKGKASDTEIAAFAAHLSTGCSRCQGEQRWLAEVVRLKEEDTSFDVPEELIEWSVSQFKVRMAQFSPGFRQLLAQLIFDTLTSPRLSPVRSDQQGERVATPRQLLYRVPGYDIDLRFERTVDNLAGEMVGQVLSDPGPVAGTRYIIRLLKDEIEIGQTASDPSGMFLFSPVPAGKFDLKVEVPGGVINIDGILNNEAQGH